MTEPHPAHEDLVLAALPAESPDPAVAAHLQDCAVCRADVAALARTVTLAQDGVADLDRHPVPERVWAAIAAEIGPDIAHVEPEPAFDAGQHGLRTVVAPRKRRWRAIVVPVAAALVALAVGIGIGAAIPSARTPPAASSTATIVARLYPIGGADPAGNGTLTAERNGDVQTMVVHLSGVTNLDGADFLEAWLMNPTATEIVSLGALTRRDGGYDGTFTVPTNLPMAQLTLIDISAEHYDGDPGHSGLSILRGTLT